MIDRALTLNPNMTSAWMLKGWAELYLGEPDNAIDSFDRAIRFNPLDPLVARMQTGTAAASFLPAAMNKRRFEPKGPCGNIRISQPLLRVAAASHALTGRIAEAGKIVTRIRQLDPELRLSRIAGQAPFRRPEDVSRVRRWAAKGRSTRVNDR